MMPAGPHIGEMGWRWEGGPAPGRGAQKGTELKVCAMNRVTGERAVVSVLPP